MTADDQIGYGLRDGILVFVSDVQSGLACGCLCAHCGKRLVAKKGLKRRHHFAHFEATDCSGAAESILHLLAKELLTELDEIDIPPYEFLKVRETKSRVLVKHRDVVAKGGKVRIDRVRVEESEGDFIPDIIIETGPKILLVEVAVTHKVERFKLRKIRKRNLPAIEINLDPEDSFLSRERLKIKLQKELNSKKWLFHPDQREAERIFIAKYRAALLSKREWLQKRKIGGIDIVRVPRSPQVASYAILQPSPNEWDRTAEEFFERRGYYPTMLECQKYWPHLYRKNR